MAEVAESSAWPRGSRGAARRSRRTKSVLDTGVEVTVTPASSGQELW